VRLAIFKDLCVACTLKRCWILADLSERIKSELRETVAHDALAATRVGVDHHDRCAGLLQPQRGAGPAADQGHPAAVHFLRRVKPVCDAGQRRSVIECEPADGVGGKHSKKAAQSFLGKII
jgi:hypothetical protein